MAAEITWYQEWFDSPYYHILYKHRDYEEASRFMDKLLAHLNPARSSTILDLACGRGRHAIYLANKGYDVTGIDLSENNIREARKHERAHLRFYRHDMRLPFRINYFDYVFNLFTSFGYFEKRSDNFKTVQSVYEELKPGGTLAIDFLNAYRVINHLIPEETKVVDGITFVIRKEFSDNKIIKSVEFEAGGEHHEYQEIVEALQLEDFTAYFDACGLEIRELFGDYHLNEYRPSSSERLIILARKPT